MAKNIGGECSYESESGESRRLPIAYFRSYERLVTSGIRKPLKSHSGAKCSGSTIRFGGVGLSNTSSCFDIQAPDFGVVDTATAVTSGGGGRPRTDRELFRFNREGPAGIELYDVGPTNGELLDWVGDDDSLVAKADFWSDQEDINTSKYKECDADTRHFAGHPALVETRPCEESAEHNSDSRKDQVGVGSVSFSVIHSTILSYLTADSIKAVS